MSKTTLQQMIQVTENDRKQLKKIQLELLLYFKQFCEKHNLTFYLYGGTLLGAIRHKGYIPWDDDIDVCMPRKDYDTFLSLFKSDSAYYVENHTSDPKYFLHFTKLMKYNTQYLEYTTQNVGYRSGIFIDIFPINGYPNKKFQVFLYKTIVNSLNFKGLPSMPGYDQIHSKKRNAKKRKILILLSKLFWFFITPSKANAMRDNFIRKHQYPKSDLCVSGVTFKRVLPRELFTGKCNVFFENNVMPAPLQYKRYLTMHYGDYTKLPNEQERHGHHYVVSLKY